MSELSKLRDRILELEEECLYQRERADRLEYELDKSRASHVSRISQLEAELTACRDRDFDSIWQENRRLEAELAKPRGSRETVEELNRAVHTIEKLQAEVERLKNDGAWSKALMVPGLLAERDQLKTEVERQQKMIEAFEEALDGTTEGWRESPLARTIESIKNSK